MGMGVRLAWAEKFKLRKWRQLSEECREENSRWREIRIRDVLHFFKHRRYLTPFFCMLTGNDPSEVGKNNECRGDISFNLSKKQDNKMS